MAFLDLNQDGKIDRKDDFLEYKISEDMEQYSNHSGSSGGMSLFGAFLCMASGLVYQVLIYYALDINVRNIPGILLAIFWLTGSFLTTWVVYKIKKMFH